MQKENILQFRCDSTELFNFLRDAKWTLLLCYSCTAPSKLLDTVRESYVRHRQLRHGSQQLSFTKFIYDSIKYDILQFIHIYIFATACNLKMKCISRFIADLNYHNNALCSSVSLSDRAICTTCGANFPLTVRQ